MNEFVPLEEAERTAAELARAKPSGAERPLRFQIARFAAIKPDGNAQYLVKGLLQAPASLSSGARRNVGSPSGRLTR